MGWKLLNSFMVISFLMVTHSSFASESIAPPRAPCQTGIPSPLRKPKDITPLGCERPFTIHGETYSTDSPQAQDASTLKYFVQSVPESSSILDEYQSARTKSKISAYTGTLGVLLFILSNPISKQFNTESQDSVRTILRYGGAGLAAGGFFYSFTLLRTNEYLIPKAVEAYNKSKPNDPIELQFTTGWRF